ncbi:UNKNOWN [Stylonychia lemnae]|uniref:Uncharacterized protein n=1 Tax=Stylonychia lemnae TaxID=5949 RepID=A0A077ZZ92_STYLE|nr:UNKNOWN [Stylonychia lemnae]|eukprot:CDW73813.1 UNKNOWN [Stylonychia lemnae]
MMNSSKKLHNKYRTNTCRMILNPPDLKTIINSFLAIKVYIVIKRPRKPCKKENGEQRF